MLHSPCYSCWDCSAKPIEAMCYKKQIAELIAMLNTKCGTTASLSIESGCYYLCRPDGSRYNPFASSGVQPSKSGTGLYLYLLGLADGVGQ